MFTVEHIALARVVAVMVLVGVEICYVRVHVPYLAVGAQVSRLITFKQVTIAFYARRLYYLIQGSLETLALVAVGALVVRASTVWLCSSQC